MSKHFKQVCKHCYRIVAQCRCPAPDKQIELVICNDCMASKGNTTPTPEVSEATPESKAQTMELRDKVNSIRKLRDSHQFDESEYVDQIVNLIAERERLARIDPFDFVEPCEEGCSAERHAYHEGQWDMANRIGAHYEQLQTPTKEANAQP